MGKTSRQSHVTEHVAKHRQANPHHVAGTSLLSLSPQLQSSLIFLQPVGLEERKQQREARAE
jgi:hypothetical protein